MKHITKKISLFFLAFALVACSDSNTAISDPTCTLTASKDVKQVRSQVIGEWNWVQSEISGRTGATIETPASTGKKRTLSVTADGNLVLKENGVVTNNYSYDIVSTTDGDIVVSYLSNGVSVSQYKVASCAKSLRLTNLSNSLNEVTLYSR
jgi:hypothetical protein